MLKIEVWRGGVENRRKSWWWAQHEPSWSQVGSKLRPRWAMLASRWACWAQFGDFGRIREAFLEHFGRCIGYQTTLKNICFYRFFEVLGWLDGMVEASWQLSWAMLAPRWWFLVDVAAMLRHVGGKMATKSAKMSQQRRQGANPRGFEGFAGTQDGREASSLFPCDARSLEGVAR